MIRINLLPFRAARTKENIRRQVSIFILLIILMLAGMGAYTIQLSIKVAALKQKVDNEKVQLDKFTKKAKQVDELNKANTRLQKKIDIINELELIRKEPIVLFSALTDVIVEERMWLSNFNVKDKNIDIKGTALDEITVADFTKRLQSSPVFENVVLKFLKQTEANKIKMKSFEITCSIAKLDNNAKIDTSKALK